ncbi:hypothetical protein M2347_003225 [Chryseobacterium sp. H1D6B]|uniref:hypothetical protein n=1 Tax=Chryseobacterium sp. H1D6B TaxID=2940588 RepID=UPI0015C81DCC|nr:hypothetical protein [Chryseobacterium sp. H1D6B]MDH6253498.1 hypothetical protein [Chryseobacterium sp. H1D6B]
MKKLSLSIVITAMAFSFKVSAQVGINTPNPASTLDLTAKNPTGVTTNVDGLLVPRVDRQRAQSMAAVPVSTLIYVNDISTGTQTGTAINIDAVGHYSYNGTAWTKLTPAAVNIYNSNGTLTGNRVVTQGANTLAFTTTAVNGFSVAGTNFSVDGTNNRVGIGIAAPLARLHVDGGESRFSSTTSQWGLSPSTGGTTGSANSLEIIDRVNSIRRMILNDNGDVSLGGNIGSNSGLGVISIRTGSVGVGIIAPTNTLDVNGTARVRTMAQAAGTTVVSPVYADPTGVLVKASPTATYGGLTSNSVTVASGATGTLITGMVDGAVYKAVVIDADGCVYTAVAEYLVTNSSFNGSFAIKGLDGLFSPSNTKGPTFTETNRTTTGVTWTGKPTCQDGGDSTALNYTLVMPSAGTINVTNNGNVSRAYSITLTRLN